MTTNIDPKLRIAYEGLIEKGKIKEAEILTTAEIHYYEEDIIEVDDEGMAGFYGTLADLAIKIEKMKF